ncbi:MAG TPA: hypothetical protein IAB21_03370 [Candidatus Avelusimicrobium excrementipullorum]|nr:hypothetical protein [Candidatus Avelusimicrobium excrementipullorum]
MKGVTVDILLGENVQGQAGMPQFVSPVATSVQVGTVQSGETAAVVNSGTPQNAVFDFVLPKGENGKDGKDGADGQDGKSAYQQAVEGGYTGTQAQFNEELGSFGDLAQSAQTAADQAQQIWQDVQKRQRKEFIYTAGTPSGTYTGSLTEIDTGTDLTGLDVEVYLNGVNKESGTEYTVSGTKITFSFELTAGSKVKVRLGDLIRTAKEADIDAAILVHNNDASAHPALDERISALEQGGGSGGGESWFTLTGENYTAQQLSNGLSSGKAGSYALGAYASKTITRVEAWAGDGTEGNPYFRLPWPYGWHRSGNFIYLYFVRGGVSLNWSEFYTNANAINVAVRAYYK